MKIQFSWFRLVALGALLTVTACSDQLTNPTDSGPQATGPSLAVGIQPDELFLIDNTCPTSNPDGTCAGFNNGSQLFRVSLTGSSAVMTHLFSLTGLCATGSSINCTTSFDQAHIGATPDGSQIWVVQRRPLGALGNPVGFYSVATGTFTYRGEISGIGPDGVVLASFSPQGDFFVANQANDMLYRVNTTTLLVQESWLIRIGSASGSVLNLEGADIAFDAAGGLFVYTNLPPATRGLYRITLSGSDAIATFIQDYGQFHTGLAFRSAGTGNLVMSNAFQDVVREVSTAGGPEIQTYAMTGALTDHKFGDMTNGKLALDAPAILIKKYTNGEDADTPTGPFIPVGGAVNWTYDVTNTGNVPLTNVTVTDDQGVVVTCPKTTLAVAEVMTCTASGVATAGQYANIGTATGDYAGTTVNDTDPSHYYGAGPAIDIKKYTNGQDADTPTGPIIPVGGAVNWTYIVTNTGNVPLTDVAVTDDKGVAVTCPKTTLAVAESMTCTASGVATAGQYANIGTATGKFNSTTVQDTDPSHYFGANPKIDIEKYTNGEDADTPTGPQIPVGGVVTWTYVVTNTGNVPLSNVTVTDNKIASSTINCGAGTNVIPTLAAGASHTCTATGTATAGQYANIGTATGQYNGQTVTDTDPSHYIGATSALKLTKVATGGATVVAAGQPISFTIKVENTGTLPLANVMVSDNLPGGLGINWTLDPAVAGCAITGTSPQVLNCTFASLAVGASRTIVVRTQTQLVSCKIYQNTAKASATGVAELTANASINLTCPPPPLGVCEGGVTKVVVRYIGTTPLGGQVRGQRRNPSPSAILAAIISGVGPNTLYTFAIQSMGGQFDAVSNGRLANNFKIFIGTQEIVDFHTSCSQPIFPGMLLGPATHRFEIVEVWSKGGGRMGPP